VSFATAACQRVFTVVCVKYHPQFSNGWFEETMHINFRFTLKKLHQKCMKSSEQLSMTMPWKEDRLLSGFLYSNMGNLGSNIKRMLMTLFDCGHC
jgi:hypothetical protein